MWQSVNTMINLGGGYTVFLVLFLELFCSFEIFLGGEKSFLKKLVLSGFDE